MVESIQNIDSHVGDHWHALSVDRSGIMMDSIWHSKGRSISSTVEEGEDEVPGGGYVEQGSNGGGVNGQFLVLSVGGSFDLLDSKDDILHGDHDNEEGYESLVH